MQQPSKHQVIQGMYQRNDCQRPHSINVDLLLPQLPVVLLLIMFHLLVLMRLEYTHVNIYICTYS